MKSKFKKKNKRICVQCFKTQNRIWMNFEFNAKPLQKINELYGQLSKHLYVLTHSTVLMHVILYLSSCIILFLSLCFYLDFKKFYFQMQSWFYDPLQNISDFDSFWLVTNDSENVFILHSTPPNNAYKVRCG